MNIRRRALSVVALAGMLAAACSSGDRAPEAAPPSSPHPTLRKGAIAPTPIKVVTRPADGWRESGCELPLEHLRRVRRGFAPGRSHDVVVVPREPNFFGGLTVTSHSGPWDYVQKVPLVLYGPGFVKPQGELTLDREATVADLAPTIAELIGTPFPDGRPGRAITEALVSAGQRPTPKAIVVVVWDGGGWNVLDTWPRSWPNLAAMMENGTSVTDAVVGSSPSVTPPIHATIGTGAWPKQHGIVDMVFRSGPGQVTASYADRAPAHLEVPTLADLYDRRTGNRAQIGMFAFKFFHLGMIGHGASVTGGDHDIAIIGTTTPGKLETNPAYYSLPSYLQEVGGFADDIRAVDQTDGKVDGKWMGHDLGDWSIQRHSPVWARYQTRLVTTAMEQEGFGRDRVTDLFFTNYKEIDDVGHNWNMLNPEMKAMLQASDEELAKLTEFLDRHVGKRQWVMAVTADHGQGPDPFAIGAWPIRMQYLTSDLSEHFGVATEDLLLGKSGRGFWFDEDTLATHGISLAEIADWFVDYRLEENIPQGEDIPPSYEKRLREPIFAAAWPGAEMGSVWRCARNRAREAGR